jgi:hypothetical protein
LFSISNFFSQKSWWVLTRDQAIKRRVKAKQNFREFQAARRTIDGYEAIHRIRKGQARWVSSKDFENRISSSTSCSICLPDTHTEFISGQFPSAFSKVQHSFYFAQLGTSHFAATPAFSE